MEICVHWHRWFQVHPWNRAKKRHTKISEYFVIQHLILSIARQECVATALTICLFSDLSSSLLLSDREVRAGTNLYWRYACFSPIVPLKYSRFEVQVSKAYGKSGAAQAGPAAPLPTAM